MYANVVSIQYKSALDADEAIKKIETSVLPEVRKVPGFQRFHLVRTGETSTMHIGVFDTAANAEAGRKRVYPFLSETVAAHAADPPRVEHGDVRVSASG